MPGYDLITAWIDGLLSTEELDKHMSDPEYLRALNNYYNENLMMRWGV